MIPGARLWLLLATVVGLLVAARGAPADEYIARRARAQYGAGAVVMMLVPRTIDAGLFGGISRLLAERGEDHGATDERGRRRVFVEEEPCEQGRDYGLGEDEP